MDTHIQPDPETAEAPPLHVSLPDDVLDRARKGDQPDGERLIDGQPEEGGSGHGRLEADHGASGPGVTLEDRLAASSASSPAPRPRRKRNWLLATAAFVLLVGAGAAYVVSPYNTVYPVPRMASAVNRLASQAGLGQPVLAPSAQLAHVHAPDLPPAVQRDAVASQPRSAQVDEIIGFKAGASRSGEPGGSAAATTTTRSAALTSPSPAVEPGEPGGPSISASGAITLPARQLQPPRTEPQAALASAPAAQPDLTRTILSGMQGAEGSRVASAVSPIEAHTSAAVQTGRSVEGGDEAAKQASPAPAAEAPPPAKPGTPAVTPASDAATIAAALQAAPMSTADQVQVLELVTRLGTLVADQRHEVDQLRADLARSRIDETARIDDFQRRLSFAEAQHAVAKAAGAPDAPPPAQAAPAADQAAASPAVVRPTLVSTRAAIQAGSGPASSAQAGSGAGIQRYRVQAASPGLAMLAAIDRAGDEGAQLQVSLGDTVPGYGRVLGVGQVGTSWVVRTEHGTIGQ